MLCFVQLEGGGCLAWFAYRDVSSIIGRFRAPLDKHASGCVSTPPSQANQVYTYTVSSLATDLENDP